MCLFNGFRCIHFRLAKPASLPAQWQQKIMQRPQQKNSISCKLPTRTLRVICGRHAAAKRCGVLTTLQSGAGGSEEQVGMAPKGLFRGVCHATKNGCIVIKTSNFTESQEWKLMKFSHYLIIDIKNKTEGPPPTLLPMEIL